MKCQQIAALGCCVALVWTAATGARAQSLSLDDDPSNPVHPGTAGGGTGFGAEDPYGMGLFGGSFGGSPSVGLTPIAGNSTGDAAILEPGPLLHHPDPNVTFLSAFSTNHNDFFAFTPLPDPFFIPPTEQLLAQSLTFSADRTAIGAPATALVDQSGLGQAPGDVFSATNSFSPPRMFKGTLGPGSHGGTGTFSGFLNASGPIGDSNTLRFDESDFGLRTSVGVVGPTVAVAPPSIGTPASHDNLDAFDFNPVDLTGNGVFDSNLYLTRYHDDTVGLSVSPGDIFVAGLGQTGATATPYATASQLGLGAADAVDALVMFDNDDIPAFDGSGNLLNAIQPQQDYALFSLAPGSAALATHNLSPGDVFYTDFNGFFAVYARATELGLLTNDNLDSLDAEVHADELFIFVPTSGFGNLGTWVGGGPSGGVSGNGATWEQAGNWEQLILPNGPDHVATFQDLGAFGSPVTIDQDGSRGPITAKLRYDNAFVTHTSSGGNPHILDDDLDQPHVSLTDSDVTLDQGVNLQTDTLIKLGSNQPAGGFSRLTFLEPIETNDNDITIAAQPNITGLVTITEDVSNPNNTTQLSLRNAIVEVNQTLSAQAVEVSGGEVFVPNINSQLKVPALALRRGGGITIGDSTDPLPDLNQDVHMHAGTFNGGTQPATIPQGATLMSGHNTFHAGFGTNSGFNFNGPLQSLFGTAAFQASSPASQIFGFNDVSGRVGGDAIPYAIFNDNDYARYDSINKVIKAVNSYLPDLNLAGPTDPPVEVSSTQVLTVDRETGAVKLSASGVVGLNNFTLTPYSLLATDFANEINDGVIVPVAGPNGILYIHVPQGNDNLTLSNVNIANNGTTPAHAVMSGNGGVEVVNSTWTNSGDIFLNAGVSFTINNSTLGSGTIFLGDGGGFPASLVLQDTTVNDITATPSAFDPFPGDGIVANGTSTISGNISVRSDAEAPRTLGINVPNIGDSLTITGNTGPDDPNSDGFNLKIQGSGTVHLAEGTTHTIPGTIVVESAEVRIAAEIIRSENLLAQTGGISDNFLQMRAAAILSGSGSITSNEAGFLGAAVLVFFGAIEPGDSIGTLTFADDVAFLGTEGSATYRAELTDTGQADRLDIAGGLDLSGTNDVLELDFFSGSTLNGDYLLATFGQRAGVFDTVTFLGNPIADPTAPGAFNGTHQLVYGATSLLLTPVPEPGTLILAALAALVGCAACACRHHR